MVAAYFLFNGPWPYVRAARGRTDQGVLVVHAAERGDGRGSPDRVWMGLFCGLLDHCGRNERPGYLVLHWFCVAHGLGFVVNAARTNT